MPRNLSAPARAMIALLVLSLVWGYNWVVMKETLHYVGPFQFGAIRTFFGSLLLFAILLALGKPLGGQHRPAANRLLHRADSLRADLGWSRQGGRVDLFHAFLGNDPGLDAAGR